VRRFLLLAVLVATLYLAWYHETRFPLRSPGDPGVPFVVTQGESAGAIGRRLHALGLVRHPAVFWALILVKGAGGHLRAGEYSLDGPVCLDEIVDILARGDVVRHEITFPEGKTLEEMAEIAAAAGFEAARFLSAARDPSPIQDLDPQAGDLEGYLFPDTYDLRPGGDAAALVSRMVQRFREVVGPLTPRLAERNLTLRETVILASLVELETGRGEERPRIAAVFQNRLDKAMPLQTDPTVIYALRKAGSNQRTIHKKDLSIDSPYNTYRHRGLPPGPIAAPGRPSLEAVLYPAPVKDLYFVSRNDGTHYFSETLVEHLRAVDRYQKHRGA